MMGIFDVTVNWVLIVTLLLFPHNLSFAAIYFSTASHGFKTLQLRKWHFAIKSPTHS